MFKEKWMESLTFLFCVATRINLLRYFKDSSSAVSFFWDLFISVGFCAHSYVLA